jgi:hypothetical protein
MLIDIFRHTPPWVWVVFAKLVAIGLWQVRSRLMSLTRVTVLPVVMATLSLLGVANAFGPSPVAFAAWAGGIGLALAFGRGLVAVRGAVWLPASAQLSVPGSWLPLALILALFSIKYGAGASLAMHPALAADATFAAVCSGAYGLFSGLFAARALSLRRLARPQQCATALA